MYHHHLYYLGSAELQYWETQNLKGIGRQLSFILRFFFRLPLDIFKEQTVLEVGTGPVGFVSLITARRKYGIEPLKEAFENIFPLPEDVEWIANKGEEIPLKDNSVDTVLCFNVIPSHVDDVDKCLAEINRVLTKKGTLVFGMKDDVKDQYHKHIYSRAQMKRKMQEYFEVVKEVDRYRMYGLFCKHKLTDKAVAYGADATGTFGNIENMAVNTTTEDAKP